MALQRSRKMKYADDLGKKGRQLLGAAISTTVRDKFEGVSLLMERSAEEYLLLTRWRQAADSFMAAAEAEYTLGEIHASATFFEDAAKAYEKVDPEDAIASYERAIGAYAEVGNFIRAAVLQEHIAQIYEEDGALLEAADALNFAGDYYVGEAMLPNAIRCFKMSGAFLCDELLYPKAQVRFEMSARYCLEENLTKFDAPTSMMNAVLTVVCTGNLGRAYDMIDAWSELDFRFDVCREKRFLLDILASCKVYDVDEIMDHVWNFDYVVELEPFQLRMIHRIVRMIEAGPPKKAPPPPPPPGSVGGEDGDSETKEGSDGEGSESGSDSDESGALDDMLDPSKIDDPEAVDESSL